MMHDDDPRVSAALRSGVLLGAVDRLIEALWRSAAQSRTAAMAPGVVAPWRAQQAGERRVSRALLLISAAVASVALTMVSQAPPGWLWVVPPAMAVSIGLLCLRSSK